MPSPLMEWTLVNGVTYQGNAVYRQPYTDDLAWEYCENLLALPDAVETAIRNGKTGPLP